MKKFVNYYHDGKIKYNGDWYYYRDKDNYLFSKGIYKTKIKEEDLPDYFVKVWLCPRYEYISLKGIKDIIYKPNFFTNHFRKDDILYISYDKKIEFGEYGLGFNYDVLIHGPEIDYFISKLFKYGYDFNVLTNIKKLMDKKDKWYNYWEEHKWNGNYSYTSDEIWKEILGDE